jgi:peroxiredoxin 2/4
MCVVRDYECLVEDKDITFRGSYLIDPNDSDSLCQITVDDLLVGRSVNEALRLVQAFQSRFTVP